MASVTIDVSELPARLREAIALARAGTEVVVQDTTGPVVKLVPAEPTPPPARREWVFNMHPGSMVMAPNFDDYIDDEDFLRATYDRLDRHHTHLAINGAFGQMDHRLVAFASTAPL